MRFVPPNAAAIEPYVPELGAPERPGAPMMVTIAGPNGAVVCATAPDQPESAERLFAWMSLTRSRWAYWGRLPSIVGAENAARMIEKEHLEHVEALALAATREAEAAERATRLAVGFGNGSTFHLNRGDEKYFVMKFSADWERARFWDWGRHTSETPLQWREIWEKSGAAKLEQHLLGSMLRTEAAVRKAGLSAGGRRPLRFWRGD